LIKIFLIAIGGAISAILRYLISGIGYKILGNGFAWGTLIVNLTGSFLIGFLWEIFENSVVSATFRIFLLIGFLGAFTTFSSYTLETLNFLRDNEVRLAIMNIFLNNVVGVSLVFFGILCGKLILR